MNNQIDTVIKDFELDRILTITTGYNCVDDFEKVWELIWFICDDDMIGPMGLASVIDDIRNHLLEIHPELKNVTCHEWTNIDKFILEQEEKFGSVLPVTKLDTKLQETDKKLVKKM